MHHRHPVLRAQALANGLRRRAGDVHPVALAHRARGVEHQRHVERAVVRHLRRLEPDPDEVLALVQRMRHQVAGDGEAPGVRGRRVLVAEGVDPLFGPHRVRLDVVALLRPGERELVRRAVGVQAEGRDRVVGGGDHRLPPVVLEGGVGRAGRRGPGAAWAAVRDPVDGAATIFSTATSLMTSRLTTVSTGTSLITSFVTTVSTGISLMTSTVTNFSTTCVSPRLAVLAQTASTAPAATAPPVAKRGEPIARGGGQDFAPNARHAPGLVETFLQGVPKARGRAQRGGFRREIFPQRVAQGFVGGIVRSHRWRPPGHLEPRVARAGDRARVRGGC